MPTLSKIAEVEMVAFCDTDKEKAEKAAKEFGCESAKVYVDYKAPVVTPRQALVVTKILEAIYESSKTGKPVYLNK